MRNATLWILLLLVVTTTGCASNGARLNAPQTPELGYASYYGREFSGRRTASGERYDEKKLTAAHPSLPFGTHARVTNLRNGRSVVVRINDRGPFKSRRVIDLSRRAAKALDFLRQGLARVRVDIVGSEP